MKRKRDVNFFTVSGTLTEIGELKHVERYKIPDLYKKLLTIELADGQKFFGEIRNRRIRLMDQNMIKEGDLVNLEYSFEGSEKGGKKYNNIYINKIEKV